MAAMTGGQVRAERSRRRCAVFASIVLLACQLALIHHTFGTTHARGELCQLCAQFDGSGHSPPPADLSPLVRAIGPTHAVEELASVVVSAPVHTFQARAPPAS